MEMFRDLRSNKRASSIAPPAKSSAAAKFYSPGIIAILCFALEMCAPVRGSRPPVTAHQALAICDSARFGLPVVSLGPKQIIAADKGDLNAAEVLADNYLAMNKFKLATHYFSLAYKRGPRDALVGTYKLGIARFCAGDKAGAYAIFARNYFRADKDPLMQAFLAGHFKVAFMLSETKLSGAHSGLSLSGEFPATEEIFAGALRSAADGRLNDARRKLNQALADSENFGAAHLMLGMIDYAQGHRKEATTEWFETLESWQPQPPDTTSVTFDQAAAMVFLTKALEPTSRNGPRAP